MVQRKIESTIILKKRKEKHIRFLERETCILDGGMIEGRKGEGRC